jgi:hypothetical protein
MTAADLERRAAEGEMFQESPGHARPRRVARGGPATGRAVGWALLLLGVGRGRAEGRGVLMVALRGLTRGGGHREAAECGAGHVDDEGSAGGGG